MFGDNSESGCVTYPNCRCVDLTKPVCFFCEDTLDDDLEEEDTKEKDNAKDKKQGLG